MNEFEIKSVNISVEKGTVKVPIHKAALTDYGVAGDAHSGKWHRQVSLLALESIDKFGKAASRSFKYGEFAENLTTYGVNLLDTAPLDVLKIGDTELEVTQLGKKCHGTGCAIYREVGNCVMPKEGIFCRVIKNGEISEGMKGVWMPKVFKVKVITLSDRASMGVYEDLSGPALASCIEKYFNSRNRQFSLENIILPDDPDKLKLILIEAINSGVDLVFTTGGTGLGPRDFTPEIVKNIVEKEIPGIMEMIRVKYGAEKPGALLSRAVCGLSGKTLIFALPGSVKAVNEYMSEIEKNLMHLIYMMHGLDLH